MNSDHSGSFSSTDSEVSSAGYAEMERASVAHLLPNKYSASVKERKSSSGATIVAIVSLVISILCLAAVGLFCAWVFAFNDGQFPLQAMQAMGRTGGGDEVESEVCLPCVQISPNPLDQTPSHLLDKLDVRNDVENVTKICCASTSAQFAALFKLILQRQQAVTNLADMMDKEPDSDPEDKEGGSHNDLASSHVRSSTSAHLVFKPQPAHIQKTRTDQPQEQQWKSPSESPMSHMRAGLKFHDKRILIQTPGLYYIYCQILYSPSSTSSSSSTSPSPSPPDHVSTYVKRYSILRPAAPEFLLKARHTRNDANTDRHSSYVGGVFMLYKGDSLYVQLSKPHLVSNDDKASFFGLFKIGESS